ncbi:MAG: tetratricopeptide repeat protein [Thermoguttaceae bacterium]
MKRFFLFLSLIFFSSLVVVFSLFSDGFPKRSGEIPKQKIDAKYAPSESCTSCHDSACKSWESSDHAHAMDHASEKSVLGAFSVSRNSVLGDSVLGDSAQIIFHHIGFDDLLQLSNDEITIFLETLESLPVPENPKREYFANGSYPDIRYNVPGRKTKAGTEPCFADLALASLDSKSGVIEKLYENMSDSQKAAFDAEREYRIALKANHPGDITASQYRITNLLRKLIDSQQITSFLGTSFRMFKEDSRFMVETDCGVHEILFVLGKRPLQQYLVATEGGRLQSLPVAWDTVENKWFHLYPKEQILKGDPLHWTESLQNWNRMCADCHTTNLWKNFDPNTKSYQTTFSDTNVGCQTCHGPCADHVRVAEEHQFRTKWGEAVAKEVQTLSAWDVPRTMQTCVTCHTRRRILCDGPKPPETPITDWIVPELPDASIYYPDGQLLEEAFEYGSFVQSKMHSRGVGCTNCHDPHSLELKFQGNRLCTQCHSPTIYDTVSHHFHPDTSKPGTQCVECHFVQSTYMVVDPRRDHSIRKPSPALTLAAGVPNACTNCHQDRKKGETLQWAQLCVDKWYAEKRKKSVGYSDMWPTEDHYALAISAARNDDIVSVSKLLEVIKDRTNKEFRSAIRAAALTLLARFIGLHERTEEIFEATVDLLKDDDALIRTAAVDVLANQPDSILLQHITPLLNDPVRAVRIEAARVLASVSNQLKTDDDKNSYKKAEKEYRTAQYIESDQPASYLNLAVLEHNLSSSQIDEVKRWLDATLQNMPPQSNAETEAIRAESQKMAFSLIEQLTKKSCNYYKQSLDLNPDFLPSRINLAMLYHDRGDEKAAEDEFLEALRIEPENGYTAYSLGLLYSELGRLDDAEKMLRRADEALLHLGNAAATKNRVRYNLAILLLQQKRFAEAEKEFVAIIEKEPHNVSFLYALFSLYFQNENKADAEAILNRIIKEEPKNEYWRQLKSEILKR